MGYWSAVEVDAMRSDMDKVIVERPRLGRSGSNKAKGSRKRLQKGWPDNLPRQEGIKRRSRGGTKTFNEHLGPLRRFLASNVGRPWDKVFSEMRAHININSVVQAHILTHVFDYVNAHAVLIDGVPCRGGSRRFGTGYSTPLHPGELYVCPRTGLLRKVKRPDQRPTRKEPPRRVKVDDTHLYCLVDGAWHRVTVEQIPPERLEPARSYPSIRDAVLRRLVTVSEVIELYGAPVVGVASRRLSKRELRQLPIPMDWQK
jgi:hypothetical protein